VRLLRKLGTFIALIATAAVFAAVYGALHDQLSYTVAPEYYTRFKFDQFAAYGVRELPPRLGAAVVGALATWWVGLYAGILVAGAGFRHTTPIAMARATMRAYGILALVALAGGLLGLLVGWVAFGSNEAAPYVDWWRPAGLTAPRRFYAVGMMHNAGYLGGAVGALVATAYQIRSTRQQRGTPGTANAPAPAA